MAVPLAGQQGARAVILDLDHTVIDSAAAWAYTVEEAVALSTGRRLDCRPLAAAYRWRPWRDVLSVILSRDDDFSRCEALCRTMFARSAMKRLSVFDGVGMGLDRLRIARVEIGGISRHPHSLALRQLESTGTDRFFTVLSAQPEGEPWSVRARVADCLNFLECQPDRAAFVAVDRLDLLAAAGLGVRPFTACWPADVDPGDDGRGKVAEPRALERTIAAAWQGTR